MLIKYVINKEQEKTIAKRKASGVVTKTITNLFTIN